MLGLAEETKKCTHTPLSREFQNYKKDRGNIQGLGCSVEGIQMWDKYDMRPLLGFPVRRIVLNCQHNYI